MRILLILFIISCLQSKAQLSITVYQKLLNEGNYQKLKSECLKQLETTPLDPASLYYLGLVSIELGDNKNAVSYLEKACQVNPKGEYFYRLALANAAYGETAPMFKQPFVAKDIVASLRKAVSQDSKHTEAKYLLAKFYATAPSIMGGDTDLSGKLAEELIIQKREYGEAVWAYIHIENKEWIKAEERAMKALQINPNLSDAYDKMNDIINHTNPNRFPDYLEALEKQHPESVMPKYHLAIAYARVPRYADARQLLKTVTQLDPTYAPGFYQLGKLSITSKSYFEEGLTALESYLALRWKKGNPTYADAYWRMGNIYELINKPSEASTSYRKALELDPNHEGATLAIQKLKSKVK